MPPGTPGFPPAWTGRSISPAPLASFSAEGRIAEIAASHATAGGRTWSTTATVSPPDLRNDKPAIMADPSIPGRGLRHLGQLGHAAQLPACEPPGVRPNAEPRCDVVSARGRRRAPTERRRPVERRARPAAWEPSSGCSSASTSLRTSLPPRSSSRYVLTRWRPDLAPAR